MTRGSRVPKDQIGKSEAHELRRTGTGNMNATSKRQTPNIAAPPNSPGSTVTPAATTPTAVKPAISPTVTTILLLDGLLSLMADIGPEVMGKS